MVDEVMLQDSLKWQDLGEIEWWTCLGVDQGDPYSQLALGAL